ncbi:LENG8 [Cordylochernes scorpioides]|uniref:LENG8 n=1 Tax=Cordylochernes scorpioides TaxID=51811 RepID=A0ABY6K9K6_9ARAC|nr:LENG8 [Cordylochernes scorpioides]
MRKNSPLIGHSPLKSQQQQPPSQPQSSTEWPPSIKDYVNRAYSQCKTDTEKDHVQSILRVKLTAAHQDQTLWTKDWDKEPLPDVPQPSQPHPAAKTFSTQSYTPSSGYTPGSTPNVQLHPRVHPQCPVTPQGPPPMSSYTPGSTPNVQLHPRVHPQCPVTPQGPPPMSSYTPGSTPNVQLHPRVHPQCPVTPQGPPPMSSYTHPGSVCSPSSSSSNSRSPSPPRSRSRYNNSKMKKPSKLVDRNIFFQFMLNCFHHKAGTLTLWSRPPVTYERLQKRAARFQNDQSKLSSVVMPVNTSLVSNGDEDGESYNLVGTCRDLEKSYLRLTSAPDASTIRPIEVLHAALAKVKDHWVKNQDYLYACDQLKAIRQDLTVRSACLLNYLAVLTRCTGTRDPRQVHSPGVRDACPHGPRKGWQPSFPPVLCVVTAVLQADHHEFNQCQSQLKVLHSEVGWGSRLEFTGYLILYYVFTKNTLDLKSLLSTLTQVDKQDEVVAFALKVREAWSLANFHRFFKLFSKAPKMAGYLLDWVLARERKRALKSIIKAYRPTFPVALVQQQLAFPSVPDCQEFLASISVVFGDEERSQIDCKKSIHLL